MLNQKTRYTLGLVMAIFGVVTLGSDQLIISADTPGAAARSFSYLSIIGLFFLLVSCIWLFRTKYEEK